MTASSQDRLKTPHTASLGTFRENTQRPVYQQLPPPHPTGSLSVRINEVT